MNNFLQTEREIKGYVEIEYSDRADYPDYATQQTYPQSAPICGSDRFDIGYSNMPPGRMAQNYASLENNYFLLDGSFVLPTRDTNIYYGIINYDTGYISNEILETYTLRAFYAWNLEDYDAEENQVDLVSGLTLYFKDNNPGNIHIEIMDKDYSIVTFDFTSDDIHDEILQVEFSEDIYLFRIDITLSNMEYSDRRLRIVHMDLGLTDILKDNNLINFTILDQIDEYNIEIPSSTLTINLYDEDDRFDVNNPKGFARYLNKERFIKPRIGILTPNDGIQYEFYPTYYLNSWRSNGDKLVTLNCMDYIEILKSKKLDSRLGHIDSLNRYNLNTYFFDNFNIDEAGDFFNTSTNYFDDEYVEISNAIDYLKEAVVYMCGKIFSTKVQNGIDNRTLDMYYTNTYNGGTLTLNTGLLDIPKYTQKEKIKNINITKYLSQNNTEIYTKNVNPTGKDIDINSKLFKNFNGTSSVAGTLNQQCERVANYLIENTFNYDINFNYIGDPKIKVGANINIETQYGKKQMKVLKHTLIFNGGLTGTIEGVGN